MGVGSGCVSGVLLDFLIKKRGELFESRWGYRLEVFVRGYAILIVKKSRESEK